MKRIRKNVFIIREEFDLLKRYLKRNKKANLIDRQSSILLKKELNRAKITSKEEFPDKVVRLNSTVFIKDTDTNVATAYTLVLPENVNLKAGKISIFSPVGVALIGFRKGLIFTWNFLRGKQNLIILEVYNSPSLKM
ncbi:MAG TPA: GreA/GreB family elongation factor [Puia sp.]|jgi:regulator of nucleoside diphosphate kinase